jgi:hypothetical protein
MVVCIILNVQQSQSSKIHGHMSSHGCSHHYFWELQVVADDRTLSATYNPYFQTCCTVYILFHRPHSLEVHFTRRVSKLFDASNLLQHVGTSNSFYFSGLNSKSSWWGQEQNMEGLRFSYILFTYAHPVRAS